MTNSSSVSGIILAAGKGTRMKSNLPKCAHLICDLPMAEHVGRAMKQADARKPVIIAGYQSEILESSLSEDYFFAYQSEQLGTGHATLMAKDVLEGKYKTIFIAPGDAPLLTAEVFTELLKYHKSSGADLTLATCILKDPTGYGRIIRNTKGYPSNIIEQKDATSEVLSIDEVCTGVYCVESEMLWHYLPKLKNQNAQNEYYLTDLVQLIDGNGGKVESVCFRNADFFMGVNDRWQLSQASQVMCQRILKKHALNGVTLLDPSSIQIGADVEIGIDTCIAPMTILSGKTRIGEKCQLGPFSMIKDSIIEEGCEILMSQVQKAVLRKGSRCGPFANLRPHVELGKNAKVGNFVEVKNSLLGEKVSVAHLSYIGDAIIGLNTNIGAGTITCNYDGFAKHQTEIGANVFVGSNSTLVAPLSVGDGAIIGAGSVITQNVSPDALGLGRAKQENKEEWAKKWRYRKQMSK